MQMSRPFSRRMFLVAAVSAVVAACSDDSSTTPSSTAPGTTAAPPSTTPTTTTTTTVPAATTTVAPTTLPPNEPPTTRPILEYDGDLDPFTLGVASGDPITDSFVIWTRLAPEPLAGGGLGEDRFTVRWEVANDDTFTEIVASDAVVTGRDVGHSLHVDVGHLETDSWYFYRFLTGRHVSPVGRARTMPAEGQQPDEFVLAVANCQNYEDGFYAAHRDLAAAKPDAVLFLGDYIYEYAARPVGTAGVVRTHEGPEPIDLVGYRNRYARYKTDPDLQAAHAACPWFVIWDDHEVENNYAELTSENPAAFPPERFRPRRAAAYQVWWEHQPVRLPPPIDFENYRIYRQFWVGGLVELTLLDQRQYRSDQACGDVALSTDPACPETFGQARTMLGDEQEAWFAEALGSSRTVWSAIANEVVLADVRLGEAVLNYDQWDGYPAARERLLETVAASKAANVIVLTGDIHLGGIAEIRGPGTDVDRPVIATEFVTSSISSDGLIPPGLNLSPALFPGIVDLELEHRGWVKHTITPSTWTAEYRIVSDVKQADATVSTYKAFTVKAGTPGVAR